LEIYLVIIIVLFGLAISDLIVGVGNDAVNFLNSAVGSKVAPRHIILSVAALGILIGSTFSSGLMEVARKGLFFPNMFLFQEVMIIFLAVMLTDVILLDLYNTFGLPTSTTVSIIFELLGASVAVSLLKILEAGNNPAEITNYINTSKALAIVSGILVSVVVAFSVGAFVQFFVRIAFTFDFMKRIKRYGAIWGAVAITFITYFILVKGAKGSSLLSSDASEWINENTRLIILGSIILWGIVFQLIVLFTKINILKTIVLAGTFALALAFAANDLVNFIGVPLAGLSAFQTAVNSDDPFNLLMTALLEPVNTPTLLLLLAGTIMVGTLWFSKKARSVTKTEVNLGRQHSGFERFESSAVSRVIVRMSRTLLVGVQSILPASLISFVNSRFENATNLKALRKQKDAPSFDLIRASVNLMVSAVLISFATSLKLPLSTTYVTFMVAMGTSLSDRSWGRDSAVYRVNGVLTVISGWFVTAFLAFTVSGIFALIIFYGGMFAIAALILLAVYFIFRTHLIHKSRTEDEEFSEKLSLGKENLTLAQHAFNIVDEISAYIREASAILNNAINGLSNEDRSQVIETKKQSKKLKKQVNSIITNIFYTVKVIASDDYKEGKRYGKIISAVQEIFRSLKSIVQNNFEHIDNNHIPPNEEETVLLSNLKDGLSAYLIYIADLLNTKQIGTPEELQSKFKQFEEIHNTFNEGIIERVKFEKTEPRNSLLYLSISADADNIAKHLNTLHNQVRSAFFDINKSKTVAEKSGI